MIYLTFAGSHPGVDVYLLFSPPVLVNTHFSWESGFGGVVYIGGGYLRAQTITKTMVLYSP